MNTVFTIFPVEADFFLVLLLALQSLVHLLDCALAGLGSMEEAAGTSFLHHLSANKASELTKPIREVHNGIAITTLSIPQ